VTTVLCRRCGRSRSFAGQLAGIAEHGWIGMTGLDDKNRILEEENNKQPARGRPFNVVRSIADSSPHLPAPNE